MSSVLDFQQAIQASSGGLTLAELLAHHPQVALRTAQWVLSQMIAAGQINAAIPLSADGRDILAYADQPLQASKPWALKCLRQHFIMCRL